MYQYTMSRYATSWYSMYWYISVYIGTPRTSMLTHVPVYDVPVRHVLVYYAPTYLHVCWLVGTLGGTGRTSWYVTSWYITYQDVITYQDGMCQDVLPVPARHVPGRKKSSRQLQ